MIRVGKTVGEPGSGAENPVTVGVASVIVNVDALVCVTLVGTTTAAESYVASSSTVVAMVCSTASSAALSVAGLIVCARITVLPGGTSAARIYVLVPAAFVRGKMLNAAAAAW